MVEQRSGIVIPEDVSVSQKVLIFGENPELHRVDPESPNYKAPLDFTIPGFLNGARIHMTATAQYEEYSNRLRAAIPNHSQTPNLKLSVGLNKKEMEEEIGDFLLDKGRLDKVIDIKYRIPLRKLRLLLEFPEGPVLCIPNQQGNGLFFERFRTTTDIFPLLLVPDDPSYLSKVAGTFYQSSV